MNISGSGEGEKGKEITKETPLTIENRTVKLHEFIDARSEEVSTFTSLLRTKLQNLNKTPSQLLPKHMRRRAMSHNRYRTPSKIRNRLKPDETVLSKPLRCRRHLRKQTQLFSAYKRRSQANTWVETHVWHAKRMKMKTYFGYKVAERCWAKSGRAGFHFFKTDCLMYDMSYYEILEIKSTQFEKVIDLIKEISNPFSSNWVQFTKDSSILAGTKSGTLEIYKPIQSPNRFLENCEYIWIPRYDDLTEYKVWFIVHPGTGLELRDWVSKQEENKDVDVAIQREAFSLFHVAGPLTCTKLYSLLTKLAESEENIKKMEENNKLIKIMKLIGDPGTYPRRFVSHLSFTPANLNKICSVPKANVTDQYDTTNFDNQAKFNDAMVELATYDYSKPEKAVHLQMWNSAKPTERKFVITTRSRFTHKKREFLKEQQKKKSQSKKRKSPNKKEEPKKEKDEPQGEIAPEEEEDEEVTDARKSAIAKILEEERSRPIELTIIHDQGEPDTSKGAGFKIIVNGGKGLLIWRILTYLSCKALGMREYHQVLSEMRVPIFPQDFPASLVYKTYEDLSKNAKIATYFKKPPQKRINLIKIVSPYGFGPQWEKLISPDSFIGDELIPIYLRMTDCRIPANGAAIFLPTPEDFKKMENEKREPIHTEPLNFTKFVVPLKKISSDVYLHKLNEITISRKLIGYITTGYFSYRFGAACGKGYISKAFLNELLPFKNNEKPGLYFEKSISFDSSYDLILRNPTSRCYHSLYNLRLIRNGD